MSTMTIPDITSQKASWNRWNTDTREHGLDEVSERQWAVYKRWIDARARLERSMTFCDVGCGAGWLVERLLPYGSVTGTDLADEVIARAQQRYPAARLIAGDFMALELPTKAFHVVTTCEVLSHMADQPAFIAKLASLCKPGGEVMIATQNKWALSRDASIPPPSGWLRNWVTVDELKALMAPHFDIIEIRTIGPFRGHRGILKIINSVKLTRLANRVFGQRAVDAVKGWLGCGWTIMCHARIKSQYPKGAMKLDPKAMADGR